MRGILNENIYAEKDTVGVLGLLSGDEQRGRSTTTTKTKERKEGEMAASVDPATRKKVLRVVFISLLLDLVCSPHSPAALEIRGCGLMLRRLASHLYCLFSHLYWHIIESAYTVRMWKACADGDYSLEAPTEFSSATKSPSILAHILSYLNAYKASFARPIDSRYDIVLLGGALGSMFSFVLHHPHFNGVV